MNYDAIIFDNDGVLISPTDRAVLRSAAETAFEEAGVSPRDTHITELITKVDVDWFTGICEEYGVDTTEFWRRRDRTASVAQQAEIRQGRKHLYDDFEAVTALDPDLGIVSSNQHETIEFIIEFFELEGLFGSYYGREPTLDGLRRKKPEPYYIEKAMDDLGAETALFVGDSESDVEAAANAGIDSAFIRRPHREDYALSTEPTVEIESLEQLHDLTSDTARVSRS